MPKHPRRSLADALFSSTQQRVLGLLFGQPDRSFFATEIIERLGAGSGAVQRELKKLAESGLVEVSWVGNQKHYQANPKSPICRSVQSQVPSCASWGRRGASISSSRNDPAGRTSTRLHLATIAPNGKR